MVKKLSIKKEYFMAIVGFYGNTALVDKKLISRVRNTSIKTLIERGLLFQAVSAAVFEAISENSSEGEKIVCDTLQVDDFKVLIRGFGVHEDILHNDGAYNIKCI